MYSAMLIVCMMQMGCREGTMTKTFLTEEQCEIEAQSTSAEIMQRLMQQGMMARVQYSCQKVGQSADGNRDEESPGR